MSTTAQRMTARGGPEVEQRLSQLVDAVKNIVQNTVAAEDYSALILIGGYGRGEGGVETIDGKEHPHNNLDFLLITPGRHSKSGLETNLKKHLDSLAKESGLGLDLSLVSLWKLRTAPSLVLWYDMRYGHQTVLGDATLVPSFNQFDLDNIPAWDIRNLMVNRGTLLLINDWLLQKPNLSLADKKTVIRHAIKAIIGYGDAFLFHQGAYHWSYVEKQRRMKAQPNVPGDLRELYQEAMEFRFQPSYASYMNRDLTAWMNELRQLFAPVHLQTEEARLRISDLTWADYLDKAVAAELQETNLSPMALARRIRNFLKTPPCPGPAHWKVRLGWRCAGWRGLLPLLFPIVAFRQEHPGPLQRTRLCLNCPDGDFPELTEAYLKKWGTICETNFRFTPPSSKTQTTSNASKESS